MGVGAKFVVIPAANLGVGDGHGHLTVGGNAKRSKGLGRHGDEAGAGVGFMRFEGGGSQGADEVGGDVLAFGIDQQPFLRTFCRLLQISFMRRRFTSGWPCSFSFVWKVMFRLIRRPWRWGCALNRP